MQGQNAQFALIHILIPNFYMWSNISVLSWYLCTALLCNTGENIIAVCPLFPITKFGQDCMYSWFQQLVGNPRLGRGALTVDPVSHCHGNWFIFPLSLRSVWGHESVNRGSDDGYYVGMVDLLSHILLMASPLCMCEGQHTTCGFASVYMCMCEDHEIMYVRRRLLSN